LPNFLYLRSDNTTSSIERDSDEYQLRIRDFFGPFDLFLRRDEPGSLRCGENSARRKHARNQPPRRAALRDWQKAHAIPADGFPTEDLLTRIAVDAQTKKP
jgi:hypothetical protein